MHAGNKNKHAMYLRPSDLMSCANDCEEKTEVDPTVELLFCIHKPTHKQMLECMHEYTTYLAATLSEQAEVNVRSQQCRIVL